MSYSSVNLTLPEDRSCFDCKHRETPAEVCVSRGCSAGSNPLWEPRTDPFPSAGSPLPENPKAIHGRAKPSLALMPAAAMIEAAGVFQLGADKYGPFNWRKDPVEAMTYANAALRHIASWIDGNDNDAESGEHELAHAMCCMAIVLDARANDKLIDDRPHKGVAASLIAAKTKPVN